MKRVFLFLAVLAASLTTILLVGLFYLIDSQHGGSMGGIWGQMMGNRNVDGMTSAMPQYVWVTIASLIVVAVVGFAGSAYYLTVPEIATTSPHAEMPTTSSNSPARTGEDWEVMLRTSKPEEKKVLGVLASHDGTYLQKFIVKESGLSRLRTHRIISRFAERGVITVAKSGNTNEVSLAPWLRKGAKPFPAP